MRLRVIQLFVHLHAYAHSCLSMCAALGYSQAAPRSLPAAQVLLTAPVMHAAALTLPPRRLCGCICARRYDFPAFGRIMAVYVVPTTAGHCRMITRFIKNKKTFASRPGLMGLFLKVSWVPPQAPHPVQHTE